jgi:hypothetical protein
MATFRKMEFNVINLKSYITTSSLENLNDEEIFFKYKSTEALIGDPKNISYIIKIIKKYEKQKKK